MISHRALWPALIGVALAVGLGVQMGESVIGSINPIHFQGEAIHPRDRGAAIDPNAIQPPAQSAFAQAYGWAQGDSARRLDSGSSDFDYVPQPAVQRIAEPAWRAPPANVDMHPWRPGQVSDRPDRAPAHADVVRYTDYPIEDKVADAPDDDPVTPAPAAGN